MLLVLLLLLLFTPQVLKSKTKQIIMVGFSTEDGVSSMLL